MADSEQADDLAAMKAELDQLKTNSTYAEKPEHVAQRIAKLEDRIRFIEQQNNHAFRDRIRAEPAAGRLKDHDGEILVGDNWQRADVRCVRARAHARTTPPHWPSCRVLWSVLS